MSTQRTEVTESTAGVDEKTLADYLREHPDFFVRHPDLLETLRIPHDVAPAISLIEYQVRILREDKQRLRWRLDDLLRVARDNDRVSEQLHRLTLNLLEADGLEGTLAVLAESLRTDFRADIVRVLLIGEGLPEEGITVITPGDPTVPRLAEQFRGNRPVVGRLTREQMSLAFGERGEPVRSAAVIPIADQPAQGLLAIGSEDPDRYRGDQGTVFLRQLGNLAGRVIRHYLPGTG